MAGRVAQRPAAVAVLALDSVADPSAQRAFDATQGAVQDAQTQVRRLRSGLDETDVDVARITAFRNVEEFGAVRDGVTDSTEAIQLALNAAEDAEARVYLNGEYRISDTLYIPNFVVMSGAGRGPRSVIKAAPTFPNDGRPLIRLGRAVDTLVFGCRVEQLILNCNSRAAVGVYSTIAQEQSGLRFVTVSGFTQYGVHFTNDTVNFSSGFAIEDCEIYPQAAGAATGIFVNGAALANQINRVTVGVSGSLTNGVHVKFAQVIVVSLHVENCTNGINLDTISTCSLNGVNGPNPGGAPVTNVILTTPTGPHVGMCLVKNNATNLISYGGSSVNTDSLIPLWINGQTIFQGPLFETFEVVPSQITSNQNDYAPTDIASAHVLHLSSDAPRDLTGMVLGNFGRIVKVRNRGAFTITLKHQNAGSAAANRFNGVGSADVALLAGATVEVYKSAADSCVDILTGGAASASTSPLYDTVIDMTGTPISFGVAYDQWNVGTLGQKTLIKYITDGAPTGSSTRAVRGLAGGSNGMFVTFMNMAPSPIAGVAQFAFENALGGTGMFHNASGAAPSGGTGGCISYYYDGGTAMWRQIGTT